MRSTRKQERDDDLGPKIAREIERYEERNPRSKALFEEAREFLPGASTRMHWEPFPLFWQRGEGTRVWDADGNERLDFLGNNTALPLGHGHPDVVAAVVEQARNGFSYSGPHHIQNVFARLICERVPSMEQLRFTNSGTEATMNCVRAARAFTGRSTAAKADGAYHGTHDTLGFSGPGDASGPDPVPSFPGMPPGLADDVVVFPYNDTERACDVIERHADRLACVVVEPMMGGAGFMGAEPEFLEALREVTQRHGILLVFDEIVTIRMAPGGAQEVYGVIPDMTALGKSIGGGAAIGVFGGRRDVMKQYDPTLPGGAKIGHAGSFNGNPLSLTAGYETTRLMTPDVYEHCNRLGDRLRDSVRSVCAEFEIPADVTGAGPLFCMHFNDGPVRSYADTLRNDREFSHKVFIGLLNEGVWVSPGLFGALSAPMTEPEVDAFRDALRAVLGR